MTEIPDYVRGALAKARLALDQAAEKQQARKRREQPEPKPDTDQPA